MRIVDPKTVVAAATVSLFVCASGCSDVRAQSRPAKVQYKAVDTNMANVQDAAAIPKVLDQAAAEGWAYVGATATVIILKK